MQPQRSSSPLRASPPPSAAATPEAPTLRRRPRRKRASKQAAIAPVALVDPACKSTSSPPLTASVSGPSFHPNVLGSSMSSAATVAAPTYRSSEPSDAMLTSSIRSATSASTTVNPALLVPRSADPTLVPPSGDQLHGQQTQLQRQDDNRERERAADFRGKCLYQSRKCENERALKRNGKAHNLCDEHRSKQNQHQRKFDAKKFSRKRRADDSDDNDHDSLKSDGGSDNNGNNCGSGTATDADTHTAATTKQEPEAAGSVEQTRSSTGVRAPGSRSATVAPSSSAPARKIRRFEGAKHTNSRRHATLSMRMKSEDASVSAAAATPRLLLSMASSSELVDSMAMHSQQQQYQQLRDAQHEVADGQFAPALASARSHQHQQLQYHRQNRLDDQRAHAELYYRHPHSTSSDSHAIRIAEHSSVSRSAASVGYEGRQPVPLQSLSTVISAPSAWPPGLRHPRHLHEPETQYRHPMECVAVSEQRRSPEHDAHHLSHETHERHHLQAQNQTLQHQTLQHQTHRHHLSSLASQHASLQFASQHQQQPSSHPTAFDPKYSSSERTAAHTLGPLPGSMRVAVRNPSLLHSSRADAAECSRRSPHAHTSVSPRGVPTLHLSTNASSPHDATQPSLGDAVIPGDAHPSYYAPLPHAIERHERDAQRLLQQQPQHRQSEVYDTRLQQMTMTSRQAAATAPHHYASVATAPPRMLPSLSTRVPGSALRSSIVRASANAPPPPTIHQQQHIPPSQLLSYHTRQHHQQPSQHHGSATRALSSLMPLRSRLSTNPALQSLTPPPSI